MKTLIKLSDKYYVVVSDTSEINTGDEYLTSKGTACYCRKKDKKYVYSLEAGSSIKSKCKKIIFSTQPIIEAQFISLIEINELLGNNVRLHKAWEWKKNFLSFPYTAHERDIAYNSFVEGYKQALEDNKDKQFTLEDMRSFANFCSDNHTMDNTNKNNICWLPLFSKVPILTETQMFDNWKSTQKSKTEWPCEFIDGKLKIL